MNNEAEPPKAAEPEEDELRDLLDERDQRTAVGWQSLNRTSTRIIGLALVLGMIIFLAVGSNRDWIAAMFDDKPPAPAPAKPATVPAIFAGAMENPDEEALKRAAGMPTKADERAKARDGKIINKEDIKFAMELMQFMHGPPEKAAKDGK